MRKVIMNNNNNIVNFARVLRGIISLIMHIGVSLVRFVYHQHQHLHHHPKLYVGLDAVVDNDHGAGESMDLKWGFESFKICGVYADSLLRSVGKGSNSNSNSNSNSIGEDDNEDYDEG